MQWLTFTSGVTSNGKLFGDSSFWTQKSRELYLEHRPFRTLDAVVGNPSPHFQEWLRHPTPDAYFEAMVPIRGAVRAHGDADPDDHRPLRRRPGRGHDLLSGHMRDGSAPAARERHYLVIGPWDHAGTRTPAGRGGRAEFGKASLVDLNRLHKEWYDWTLKGGPKPDFLKKRVAYYVVGPSSWKYADSLDAVPASAGRSTCDTARRPRRRCFHSGTLGPGQAGGGAPTPRSTIRSTCARGS